MKNNVMMKGLLALALVGMVFFTSCDKDDPEQVNPLVGTYTFKSATYLGTAGVSGIEANPIEVVVPTGTTPPTTTLTFNPNDDISSVVGGVLAGVIDCGGVANTVIELRQEGFQLYYGCVDGSLDPVQSGTWSVNETAGTLSLNISSASLGQISVVLQDYKLENNVLSGTVVGFPIPKDLTMPLGTDNLHVIAVDASFDKKS